MIRARSIWSGNNIIGFEIKGHAEYAPHGEDIVCAAASFLAITVENSLELQLGKAGTVSQQDGKLSYELPANLTETQMQTAQTILQVFDTGFQNLAKEYPKFVQYKS